MSQRSDLDASRALVEHLRAPHATASHEDLDAIDRLIDYVSKQRDESKRETATLTGIEDLLRTTEAAIEEGNDDPPDQASAMATVGVMGAIAHVATNLAASADRLASIDASLKVIAEAHKPQLISVSEDQARKQREDEIRQWRIESADIVVDHDGRVWKSRTGARGDSFADVRVMPGTLVYFAKAGEL